MQENWHYDYKHIKSVCCHLIAEPDDYYGCVFTGNSEDFMLLCGECSSKPQKDIESALRDPSDETLAVIFREGYFDEFYHSPATFEKEQKPYNFAAIQHSQFPFEIAAISPFGKDEWLVASTNSQIFKFNQCDDSHVFLSNFSLPFEGDENFMGHHLTVKLHVSDDRHFCAIVHDYGRYGQLIDLKNNKTICDLESDRYYCSTVPFSVCFFIYNEKNYLIKRRDWNHLDILDTTTGECLTQRHFEKTTYNDPEYFHGGLYLSPDQATILDDGWVWHPRGWPSLFSAKTWLTQNIKESDEKCAKQKVLARDDWDCGACWLDENNFILGTKTNNKANPYAFLYDIKNGTITVVRGPKGLFYKANQGLISVDEIGLSLWDMKNWQRLGFLPNFMPQAFNDQSNIAAFFDGNRLSLLKL
ncbi:hypothetical protein [Bartonella sp. HY761]|uniref:hypothetical protein n=1 Tax=Bartonella sp. HY761 TaxID=2979330 RepID=UPI002207CD49|nr:hypothetical protein [Bartonella sp. HY761]UXN06348.1 hypothetical protein N6A79_13940 [Bartonella sp. HY761]